MGHIVKTPAGTFRANWRDPSGRQRAKTFRTRKEAAAYLAATEATVSQGTYVDPSAGTTQACGWAAPALARPGARPATAERPRLAPASGRGGGRGWAAVGRVPRAAVGRH